MPDTVLTHLQPVAGILVIITIGWLLSEDRSAFRFRLVGSALALQAGIAVLMLKVPAARQALFGLNAVVTALTNATRAGAGFVFGYVGGGPVPFTVTNPAALTSFAFGVMPLIIVISALSALLWYWRVLARGGGGVAFVARQGFGLR